jgi:hypothetical protein
MTLTSILEHGWMDVHLVENHEYCLRFRVIIDGAHPHEDARLVK